MAIFEATDAQLVEITPTTFAALGIKERGDIQRLVAQKIDVIAPDTLIIAEEFGNWADSKRRIDLLGIDKDANIVVIELKRTEDGGHMELQALRYAAMVSTLTFEGAVDTYAQYLATNKKHIDARSALNEFLGRVEEESETESFGEEVRIVLAAAEFSREITTTVLWLNDRNLDIRCVRMRPYRHHGQVLIDIQQVIPLPEAEEYQVKIREKQVAERVARKNSRDFTRYDVTVGGTTFPNLPKRRAIYEVIRGLVKSGVDPDAIRTTIPWKTTILVPVDGILDSAGYEKALADQLIANGREPQIYRFFTDDEDLIHANGKTYAATKMWGHRTALAMDGLLKAFPNHHVSYCVSK